MSYYCNIFVIFKILIKILLFFVSIFCLIFKINFTLKNKRRNYNEQKNFSIFINYIIPHIFIHNLSSNRFGLSANKIISFFCAIRDRSKIIEPLLESYPQVLVTTSLNGFTSVIICAITCNLSYYMAFQKNININMQPQALFVFSLTINIP